MRSTYYLVLICGILGCGVLACQPSAPAQSPEEAAVGFYKWYVHEIDQGHIPLSRSRDQLSGWISSSLVKRLEPKKGAEGPDADYFLKAQDTFEDWAQNVTASSGKVTGGIAQTTITLGASSETRHRLLVALIQEDGKWKIQSVSAAQKAQ